ncbi:MAG: hypothetical protein RLZZ630_459 [Bacteroidota bacterium]
MESSFSSYLLCMKNDAMTTLQRLLILFALFSTNTFSQQSTSVPRHLQIGPKGMDTLEFSEIVVFRDPEGKYDKYYLGLMIDNPKVLNAMINPNACNVIRTRKTGEVKLYAKTDSLVSIPIKLTARERTYVMLRIIERHGYPHPELTELSQADGEKRMSGSCGKVIHRYMPLMNNTTDYLEDLFPDSIHWRIGGLAFHFLRPPTMEVSMDKSFIAFHSPEISKTYSEYMYINRGEDKKVKSEETMRDYANGTGRQLAIGEDPVLSWEQVEVHSPGLAYYWESEDHTAKNKGSEDHLHIRAVSCFIRSEELHRKGEFHFLTLTERGRPEELSTKAELLDKFNYVWDSIRITKE